MSKPNAPDMSPTIAGNRFSIGLATQLCWRDVANTVGVTSQAVNAAITQARMSISLL